MFHLPVGELNYTLRLELIQLLNHTIVRRIGQASFRSLSDIYQPQIPLELGADLTY